MYFVAAIVKSRDTATVDNHAPSVRCLQVQAEMQPKWLITAKNSSADFMKSSTTTQVFS